MNDPHNFEISELDFEHTPRTATGFMFLRTSNFTLQRYYCHRLGEINIVSNYWGKKSKDITNKGILGMLNANFVHIYEYATSFFK